MSGQYKKALTVEDQHGEENLEIWVDGKCQANEYAFGKKSEA